MNGKTLSITICSHNRAHDVIECISALKPQIGDMPAQVIVIDSGSRPAERDALAEKLLHFNFVTLIRVEQPGLSRARNEAIRSATGA